MEGETEPLVRVLAAVIRRGNRYLLCRRPAHKRHGGLWEFPGGKVETGESWLEAARRELREELDLEVTAVGQPLFEHHDSGSRFLIVFTPVEASGDPRCLEHTELQWCTVAEIAEMELAPTDAVFSLTLARIPE